MTTEVNGEAAAGGATGAVTLDNSVSQASVDGGSMATGGTVDVLATTTNTANTTASSMITGAGINSAIQNLLYGKVDPNYIDMIDPPPDSDSTSPAETAQSGGLPITVAGAVAVTRFTPTTQADVDSSKVTATNAINIDSTANNNTSTAATGSTTTSNAQNSVGVAVAISDTVVNNTATVENTLGTASPTSLTAPTILVQSGTPTATAATPDLSTSASATSGVYATSDGVAGALALNLVSNTTEAAVANNSNQANPLPAIVSMAGNVTFNAQDTASETAAAQPPGVFVGGQAGSGFGLGAAVALNIDSNTTKADIQDEAQLTGANNLTLVAGSADTVATNTAFGSSGGLASISPSAAITVVTNTTDAQVGAPDALNDPLVVGGAFSATATHAALTFNRGRELVRLGVLVLGRRGDRPGLRYRSDHGDDRPLD